MPFPVPWFAGCGGMSVLDASNLLFSSFPVSALTTTALDVSGTSARAPIALVTGGAGCGGPAEASLTCPALIWTVFTLTGFIGSDEPGIAAIGWVWITPLVSGAGSDLGSDIGSDLGSDLDWAAAVEVTVRAAGAAEREAGRAAGSAETAETWTEPWT